MKGVDLSESPEVIADLGPFERRIMRAVEHNRGAAIAAGTIVVTLVSVVFTVLLLRMVGLSAREAGWRAGVAISITVPLVVSPLVFAYLARLLALLQRAAHDLHRRATIDPLTNVLNRRGLFAEIDAFEDADAVVSVVDLDCFKGLNDTHGHDFGDRALMTVAEWLADRTGEGGIVGRVGGDEFVCVAVEPIVQGPVHSIDVDGVPVGFSVGAAQLSGRNLTQAVADADRKLYEAKRRNGKAP